MRANRKKGFTLVELMIVVALLGIVLALAYQTFAYLYGTYGKTERQWILQREATNTMQTIQDKVDASFSASLSTNAAQPTATGEEIIFYCDGTDLYVYDKSTTPIKINELPVKVSFTNKGEETAADGTTSTKTYGNMLFIDVVATEKDMSEGRSSGVSLPNLYNSVGTTGEAPYNTLTFRTAENGILDITLEDMTHAGCFIATAAYGEYDEPGVMLLRRLRDQVLLTNAPGQWFVNTYYRLSPPVAEVIAVHPALRLITRVLLLPVQGVAVTLLHPVFALVVSGIYLALWRLVRRKWKRKSF